MYTLIYYTKSYCLQTDIPLAEYRRYIDTE